MSIFSISAIDEYWRSVSAPTKASNPDRWDEVAAEWIAEFGEDGSGKPDMHRRVSCTADYLRQRGLLGADTTVADVGCGPGLFVAEFAKTAELAVGFDVSRTFLGYSRENTARKGLRNAEFRYCDFTTLNVDAEGLLGAFDLTFTSITPVINSLASVEKLISMSRAWCYNSSFVHTSDNLAEQISRDVFGEPYKPRRDGKVFYSVVNILLLLGYFPETSYYDDIRNEVVAPTPENAAEFADECGHGSSEDASKVLRWMDKQGEIVRRSEFKYGNVLWDIRKKGETLGL